MWATTPPHVHRSGGKQMSGVSRPGRRPLPGRRRTGCRDRGLPRRLHGHRRDQATAAPGAQHGVDGRSGRTTLAGRSVIDGGGSAGVQITGFTSGVTVGGFTIRNSGIDGAPRDGIGAFSGGSGFNFPDSVITQTTYGINTSSLSASPSPVTRSRFDTNNRSGNQGGSGVFICCGPGNNLSITDNLFTGNNSAAVNTAVDPFGLSTAAQNWIWPTFRDRPGFGWVCRDRLMITNG